MKEFSEHDGGVDGGPFGEGGLTHGGIVVGVDVGDRAVGGCETLWSQRHYINHCI